jgi:hypothetical protein
MPAFSSSAEGRTAIALAASSSFFRSGRDESNLVGAPKKIV